MTTKPPRGFYVGETLIFSVVVADINGRPVTLNPSADEYAVLSVIRPRSTGENVLEDPLTMTEKVGEPGTYVTEYSTASLDPEVHEAVMTVQGPLGPQYEVDVFVLFPSPV